MLRPLFARSIFTICLLSLCSQSVWALQEEAPAKPEAAPETTTEAAAPVDAKAEWDKLSARKMEIALALADLKKRFETAPVEQKRAIRETYQELIEEFMLQVSPSMEELAEEIFEKEPDNQEAAEFVIQNAWKTGKYSLIIKIVERLLEQGYESETVLVYGGTAYFAENQFEQAVELLSKTDGATPMDRNLGEPLLAVAQKYLSLWEKEKAVQELEAMAAEGDELPRVELTTSKGKILVELFENEAPNTVANFISLVESGFYNGIKFHRVIPNFVVQAGDPRSKSEEASTGPDGPGYTIKCECYQENARMHFAGSLSMALKGKDTGNSQFFITHLPTPWLNAIDDSPYNHTVFGRVLEGLDIVRNIEQDDVIEAATVIRKRDHEYKPVTTADPNAAKPTEEEKPEEKKEADSKPEEKTESAEENKEE